jgi:hypothetical protein
MPIMTVTVDIANPGVLNLLRELEGLKLLRLSVPAAEARDKAGEDRFENGGECPLCAVYHEPNEETIAAFEEGDAMLRGEKSAHWHHSVENLDKMLGL